MRVTSDDDLKQSESLTATTPRMSFLPATRFSRTTKRQLDAVQSHTCSVTALKQGL